MGRASIALFAAGAAAISGGVWWLLPAAGLIVLGVLLVLGGWLFLDDGRKA